MNRLSRHPSEVPVLLTTLLLVGGVLVITTGLTVCIAPVLIAMMVAYSYIANQQHHAALMQQAIQVPVDSPTVRARGWMIWGNWYGNAERY
jgi:hypothetical protein